MSQNIQGKATSTFTLGKGKKILFVILAVAVTFGAFYFAKPDVVEASKKDGKEFGDWVVSCSSTETNSDSADKGKDSKDTTICVLTHTVMVQEGDNKQPIASFQFGYFGENAELKMIQILPLGISIPAGTSIISGNKMIARGVYATCLNTGCQAVAPISDEDLKMILENDNNVVAILGAGGNQINLPFNSKSLDKGLEFLKK